MVEVREARLADRTAVRDVHVAAVRELGSAAYDERVVAAWAGDENRDPRSYRVAGEDVVFLVAVDAGDVVGFGELTTAEDATDGYEVDADAEIRAVYVAPDHAGEGVGTALLTDLEARDRASGVSTVVLIASLNAVGFYERHGYERVVEREYAFGENVTGRVVVMRKKL